jgi:hypothetical protein
MRVDFMERGYCSPYTHDIKLQIGTTTSVLVMTGTSGETTDNRVQAALRPLQ